MTPDGWISADTVVKVLEATAEAEWGRRTGINGAPTLEAVEDLMSEQNEGGGLYGLDPVYHVVRAGLIRRGQQTAAA